MQRGILALAAAVCLASASVAGERELRAVWIPNTDTRFFESRESIAGARESLARGGINVVLPVVWSKGATLFPSEVMRTHTGQAIDRRYEGRDPLAEVLAEAHQRGIEVIPWFEYGFCDGHERYPGKLLAAHPEWAALGSDGKPVVKNGFPWLNSLDPAVQHWMSELVLEVCRKYDIDGVQGDDRLPALPCEAGYNPEVVAAYKAETGREAPKDPKEPRWLAWRAERLTEYLRDLREEVKAVRPGLVFSMAPGAPSWAYTEYLQQQERWMELGLLDALHPQVYARSLEEYERMLGGVFALEWIAKRKDKLFPGVLVRIGDWRASGELLCESVAVNRKRKLDGEVFFFHQGLLDDSGERLAALAKGPYKRAATPPWRKQEGWRIPAKPALPKADGAKELEGGKALELPVGVPVTVSWSVRADCDGGPRLALRLPLGHGLVGDVRLTVQQAPDAFVNLAASQVERWREGWIEFTGVGWRRGATCNVTLELPASATPRRIGELVALTDRSPDRWMRDRALDWKPCEDLNKALPGSLRVFEARNENLPLRAWLVEARPSSAEWRPRAQLSDDSDGLETVESFARDAGALVAINAGYFGGGKSLSLVVDDGKELSPNAPSIARDGVSLFPTRGAFGLFPDGTSDIGWVYDVDGKLVSYAVPSPIRSGAPQPRPSAEFPAQMRPWTPELALGGGPVLIESGTTRITYEEEVFFGSGMGSIDSRHPRTALGYTHDGRLLLLVVDGRSRESAGATLGDLARELRARGAVEALNLDGGGSTTLVVNGTVINQPSDKSGAREVASALLLVPTK
ncbi:MAG: family 10 glycosylhydrolase [Planctomycetota bacterium]|nr:family 10 glycosylhydrolase [Planctomycetota bacterium]